MTASNTTSGKNVSPASLARLPADIKRLLALFSSKEEWRKSYPLLAKLAEDMQRHYQSAPLVMQAQLSLYRQKYGYTENLAFNTLILACTLSECQGYSKEDGQTMAAAALATLLCVRQESDILALGETLDPEQKKRWQYRYHLALKMLTESGTPQPALSGILAKLDKYRRALVDGGQIMLYDGMTRLVAIATILAHKITLSPARPALSLREAVADLYIRTSDPHAQQLLKRLQGELGDCLAGTRLQLGDKYYLYVGETAEDTRLLAELSSNNIKMRSSKQIFSVASRQTKVDDERIAFALWFHCLPHIKARSQQEALPDLDSLFDALSGSNQSYGKLVSILAPYPALTKLVQQSAESYNREGQTAANLRHALSMVGSYNAPPFVSRVILQHQLMGIRHPLDSHIKARVHGVLAVCRLVLSKRQDLHFEHPAACLMAYLLFLCTHGSSLISRSVHGFDESTSEQVLPLALILGSPKPESAALSGFLRQHVGHNRWAEALIQSETQQKNELSGNARYLATIKLLCFLVFLPGFRPSAWQKQLLETTSKELEWKNGEQLAQSLVELGLYSGL